ncbi:MAG TPA: ferritin [Candidatus Krumholzibacterium sp.]|nr:ferritin [Candidatus Krumholzibacterium sp.]
MMKKRLVTAMNEQIMHEMFSSYLYLSMAAYLHGQGLDGMGHWMRVQALEEQIHAMKFFDHLLERGEKVALLAIEKPQVTWKSPLDAFKEALKHEKFITGKINDLMAMAIKENDFASRTLLQWFVDEQIEEEDNADKNVRNLDLTKDSGHGILMIDREMAGRISPVTLTVQAG